MITIDIVTFSYALKYFVTRNSVTIRIAYLKSSLNFIDVSF